MIGLALAAGISVLAQSVKASVTEGVSSELTSDFVLSGGVSTVPPDRLGSPPWGAASDVVLGSAATSVVEHARCPVVVVP